MKKNKLCGVFLAFSMGFLVGLPVLSYAQRSTAEDLPGLTASRSLLTSASLPGIMDEEVRGEIKFSDFTAIRGFYEGRGNMPLWTDDPKQIESFVSLLKDSWTHGLNPADYHTAEIEKMLAGPMLVPADRARLELLLTDAALRYGRDMTGMRVNPVVIGQKAKYWRQPLTGEEILQKISLSGNPVDAVTELGPQSRLYKAMRSELIRLVSVKAAQKNDETMDFGRSLFKPGKSHEDVRSLRAALNVDYDPAAGPEEFYDDTLAAAVMAFQKRHNLQPDGIVGPKTLSLLNRTTDDRIKQVIANMERVRWMEPKQPSRYIIVNIPSQMLWAVDNGKVVEEMAVVVGMPSRKTQSFKTEVTGIRFNPNWTVPLNIKMKDMLPKLQENPYALTDKGIDIIQGSGRDAVTIDPGSVDWFNVSRSEMNQFRMVQGPGANNALGNIRVLMPNDYDIYLHDTNHRELFVMDERLLSSGCVRLSEPDKIARFVLAGKEGWSDDKMENLIKRGRTTDVAISEKIPVYIVYQTMWFDGNGELVYGTDVYGEDKKLVSALKARKAYDLPDTGVRTALSAPESSHPDEAAAAGDSALGSTLLASAH